MSTIERLRAEQYRQEEAREWASDMPWCDGCEEDWPCGVFLLLAVAEAAEEMYEWMTWNTYYEQIAEVAGALHQRPTDAIA